MHPFVLLNSKGPKDRWGCPLSTPKPPTHSFLFGSFAPGSGLHSWSSWGKSRAPHCGLASDLCHQTAWFCYHVKFTVSQTDLPPDMFPLGGTDSSKRAKHLCVGSAQRWLQLQNSGAGRVLLSASAEMKADRGGSHRCPCGATERRRAGKKLRINPASIPYYFKSQFRWIKWYINMYSLKTNTQV